MVEDLWQNMKCCAGLVSFVSGFCVSYPLVVVSYLRVNLAFHCIPCHAGRRRFEVLLLSSSIPFSWDVARWVVLNNPMSLAWLCFWLSRGEILNIVGNLLPEKHINKTHKFAISNTWSRLPSCAPRLKKKNIIRNPQILSSPSRYTASFCLLCLLESNIFWPSVSFSSVPLSFGKQYIFTFCFLFFCYLFFFPFPW